MSEQSDRLTISEAASLLGVHRNTVRNRIKAGTYKAHKVITPQGETYVIERNSLGIDPQQQPIQSPTNTVHHNPSQSGTAQMPAISEQQAQVEATFQRLLAPFVRDLSEAHQTIGRLELERDQAQQERDELKARLEALETAQGNEQAPNRQDDTAAANNAPEATTRPWWQFWKAFRE